MANRPIYPDTIKNAALDVENGDGTTSQDLLTAGADGARVNYISVISDDTADVVLELYYNDLTTDSLIGAVTIPAGSGTDGVLPPVSLLNATALPFLGEDLAYYLEGADKLKIAAKVAVTAAKKVTLVASYGDY